MTTRTAATVLCIILAFGVAPQPAQTQIPDSFTNLQVLDRDISRGELVATMRGWTTALGVRCTHCHGGRDDLQGTDFASDALATKRTARRMLLMVRAIEAGHLRALPTAVEERREPARVDCHTCHRGAVKPPLATTDLLDETLGTAGVEAAMKQFMELRERHADAGRYDLRPTVLFRLARQSLEREAHDDAIAILDALHLVDPSMGDAWALRAQVEISRGRLDVAARHLEKAREVEPSARLADWVEQLLQRARGERD